MVAIVPWVWAVGLVLMLMLSWFAPQDFRETARPYLALMAFTFLFDTMIFHVGLMTLAPAALALVLRRKRLSAVLVTLSLSLLAIPLWDARPKSIDPTLQQRSKLRVFSLNVYAENRSYDLIVAEINRWDPDVIVLVEMSGRTGKAIIPQLKEEYPYISYPNVIGGGTILTRIPSKRNPTPLLHRIGEPEADAPREPVVMEFAGVDVAIYGVHLMSPSRTLKQSTGWNALGTLAYSTKENRRQVADLTELIQLETRPTIIAGDFNFTRSTANMRRLRSVGLIESHAQAGSGLGITWTPKWWPQISRLSGFRIDHILMTRELRAIRHYVGNDVGSDHLPVISDIVMAAEAVPEASESKESSGSNAAALVEGEAK